MSIIGKDPLNQDVFRTINKDNMFNGYSSTFNPPPEPNIHTNYLNLKGIKDEIGEEVFKEAAPLLYDLYLEMDKLMSIRKMGELLNDE